VGIAWSYIGHHSSEIAIVPPAELETLLCAYPGVSDACVIGIYLKERLTELPRHVYIDTIGWIWLTSMSLTEHTYKWTLKQSPLLSSSRLLTYLFKSVWHHTSTFVEARIANLIALVSDVFLINWEILIQAFTLLMWFLGVVLERYFEKKSRIDIWNKSYQNSLHCKRIQYKTCASIFETLGFAQITRQGQW
jgi:hypothetical protein